MRTFVIVFLSRVKNREKKILAGLDKFLGIYNMESIQKTGFRSEVENRKMR